MLRDITLGQYYNAASVIHRLDPRTKLVGTLIYIITVFAFKNPFIYIPVAVFLACVIKLSKVPLKFILRGLKPVWVLLFITALFNLFLTKGDPLFSVWRFSLTKEGIYNAFFLCARLIFLVIGSSLMTLTTTPTELTDGLESLLKPLRIIKVPVHEIAMMMSIALRFIPILMEELDKIMKAQMARGADFDSGNIFKKINAMIPLLIPLFISAFRRANDLALAMEARCYRGGDGRTKMKPLKYKRCDLSAYICVLLYLAVTIAVSIYVKPETMFVRSL